MKDSKCIACDRKLGPLQYANTEAGILLCRTCVKKIAKHYLEAVVAKAETDYNWAQHLRVLIQRIAFEQKGKQNNE